MQTSFDLMSVSHVLLLREMPFCKAHVIHGIYLVQVYIQVCAPNRARILDEKIFRMAASHWCIFFRAANGEVTLHLTDWLEQTTAPGVGNTISNTSEH